MSFFFPDHYACSIMWVFEQCWLCGSSFFNQFNGCNIQRILLENEFYSKTSKGWGGGGGGGQKGGGVFIYKGGGSDPSTHYEPTC